MYAWRKSSYSGPGGNCLEVGWQKSSYSGPNNNCLEVGLEGEAVGVRDTKDRDGGLLCISPTRWAAFVGAVKDDRYER